MIKKSVENLTTHNLPLDCDREGKIILSLNENVYGCSRNVNEAIRKVKYNLYPDDNSMSLRKKISKLYDISHQNVIIGNGSGELLQILCRTLLEPQDEVISCSPTYPYYFVETIVENGNFITTPLKDGKFDIDSIISKVTDKTKIIFITNPNNPTGTIITKEEQEKLIKNVSKNILIVIDEAYYEYVTDEEFPNTIENIKNYPNVCLLRTFSKAYGLAAFRVGYLIGSEYLIDKLDRVRLTFNISKISQLAAECAIEDQEFIEKCRNKNSEIKKYLYNKLNKLGIDYFKSEANFIMINLNDKQKTALFDNNVIAKECKLDGKEYVRLTIGNMKQMKDIIKLLKIKEEK